MEAEGARGKFGELFVAQNIEGCSMARVISIINNKGGTGKTTTTINLGAALAAKRKRVLLLDMDSQCNLSSALGVANAEQHAGLLCDGTSSIKEAARRVEKMWIVPSTPLLLTYEQQLNNEPGREFLIKEHLEPVQNDFDYVLIDCPPSLGTLSVASLVAADRYIVPMQAENFAFIGLDRILQTAKKVRMRMNAKLELGGILFVKFDPRTNFSKAVIKSLSENELTVNRLYETYIRQDISLMECGAFHQSILEYAPKSRGAEDYRALAKEIERQGNG